MSEWLLFNANSAIFQLYRDENKLIINEIHFVLDQHAELDFKVLAHRHNRLRVNMSLQSDTLFWFRANQSLATNTEIFNIVRFHYSLGELN